MKRKVITITELLVLLVLVIIIVKIYCYCHKKDFVDTSKPYIFVTKWTGRGAWSGRFKWPSAITSDLEDSIYVADAGNCRIEKFDSDGKFITQWEEKNRSDYNLDRIEDIYVDSDYKIYVSDSNRSGVQEFDLNGNFLRICGETSSDGLVKDSEGNVYINGGFKILKFNSEWIFQDSWEIMFKAMYEGKEVAWGASYYYSDIAIDSSGYLYVVYMDVLRTAKPPDSIDENKASKSIIYKLNSSGEIIDRWDTIFTDDNNLFSYIYGIGIDKQDRIFVADTGSNRILILDSEGNVLTEFGSKGSGNGQFRGPVDVTVDSKGNVYVLDYGNNCVQKFKPNPDFKLNVNRKEKK